MFPLPTVCLDLGGQRNSASTQAGGHAPQEALEAHVRESHHTECQIRLAARGNLGEPSLGE